MGVKMNLCIAVAVCVGSMSCRSRTPAEPIEHAPVGATFDVWGDYRLGALDEVTVRVVEDATFAGNYAVSNKGSLMLPIVGEVEVRGLTTSEASSRTASNKVY